MKDRLIALMCMAVAVAAVSPAAPTVLRTEHQRTGMHVFVQPGADVRLSWQNKIVGSATGVTQGNSTVSVVDTATGKEVTTLAGAAGQQLLVLPGARISPLTSYSWRVKTSLVIDSKATETPWSERCDGVVYLYCKFDVPIVHFSMLCQHPSPLLNGLEALTNFDLNLLSHQVVTLPQPALTSAVLAHFIST